MKSTSDSTNVRQLEWWAKDAVVYFIAAGSPPVAVKIGVSTWVTVAKRLGAIQSSNHEQLKLLGVLPYRGMTLPMKDAEDRERKLHECFRPWQLTPEGRRGYEWFKAHPTLLEFVRLNATPPEAFGFPSSARNEPIT